MEFVQTFEPLEAANIHAEAKARKEAGWRYVQILAVNKDESVKLVYAFMKDGKLENLCSEVPHDGGVESITDLYLEAFVCENEIHDLFGISFSNLAIDFNGKFYKLNQDKPMTIISPAQLAEREKAAKIAAAKAAKAKKEAAAQNAEGSKGSVGVNSRLSAVPEAKPSGVAENKAGIRDAEGVTGDTSSAADDEARAKAELEAKLAAMDPEKAAKVRAAMEAKARKAQKEAN
jgi:hypothetical protein